MKKNKKIKAFLLKALTNKKKVNFEIKKSKKVLILKYDRIGDMVVTTPIFRELKEAFPDISISVLASKINKSVVKNNPYIDEIYTNYKNSLLSDFLTLLRLRKKSFDVCIELEHSVIPHAIFRLKIINPKIIISIHKDGRYGVKGSEIKLYDFFTKKDKNSHFGKIWLDTLSFFDIKPNSTKYDFFLSKTETDKAKKFIDTLGKKIKIGINTQGSFPEKSIKNQDLGRICVGLHNYCSDVQIVILSTPSQQVENADFISRLKCDYVKCSYPTETINDAAALIQKLDIIISPDTSIIHIAASFNIPTISIHENNKDSYRLWAPTSSLNKTIFAENVYGIENYSVDDVIKSTVELIELIEIEK
jgi:ADP-heptose:LPS heptosyltransferase